jgi:transposase InsO family protein
VIKASPPVFLRLRGKVEGATERVALRAVLTAAHLFGLAAGTHLRQLRGAKDPLMDAQGRLEEADLRARLAMEIVDILVARFDRLPERRRPYYSPSQRFRILEIKNLLAWSAKETAKTFLVCANTIQNWEHSVDPTSKTVGSTVQPIPPVRRAADVVRLVAQNMVRLGYGGRDMVARTLARAGWEVSARSVARYAKERSLDAPDPEPSKNLRGRRPVIARFVHHTWMMDVSEIKQLFGATLYMAAVFDALSRVPLALEVFDQKPDGRQTASLLKHAAKAFRNPKYVITDLGGEFTATVFKNAVRRLGAQQRFASKDNLYATARLERFWRSLKQSAGLRGLMLPLNCDDLERRLELALTHYVAFRPHEGLDGATPAEAFLGSERAHLKAAEPPRGLSGQHAEPQPFTLGFLDDDRRFPILTPAA